MWARLQKIKKRGKSFADLGYHLSPIELNLLELDAVNALPNTARITLIETQSHRWS